MILATGTNYQVLIRSASLSLPRTSTLRPHVDVDARVQRVNCGMKCPSEEGSTAEQCISQQYNETSVCVIKYHCIALYPELRVMSGEHDTLSYKIYAP